MSLIPKTQLYDWFRTKKKPTQEQFWSLFDSYYHKTEPIPLNQIQDIDIFLQQMTPIDSFNAHLADTEAHSLYLTKKDASNLSADDIITWKTALAVGDLPPNIATVDDGQNYGNVYTKNQTDELYLGLENYVNSDGKILSDMIEALGLTDLIEAYENSLDEFVLNSDLYVYQKNDFIAIPDINGNYSLFMFKGGNKSDIGSYLATGLSNITISMVEGLQLALDGKLDKPASQGDFYLSKTIVGGVPYYQYKVINLQPGQIPRSFGGYIGASALFEDNGGKIGIGTNLPSEQLQLTGRGRMKALVLDDNSESLPGQITRSGNRFFGTNSSGIKRSLQYADYDGIFETINALTPTQALAVSQLLNGGSGSVGDISVNLISPPIIPNEFDSPEYVLLRGVNLNLNAISSSIQILASDKVTVVATIPNNQIQINTGGLELIFYYNFFNFPQGQYYIKIASGSKTYITSLDLTIVPQIQNINTSAITWDINAVTDPDTTQRSTTATGGSFSITTPQGTDAYTSFLGLKSSELFAQGEDFYLELNLNISQLTGQGGGTGFLSYLGVGYSSSPNNNIVNSLVNFGYSSNSVNSIFLFNNGVQFSAEIFSGVQVTLTFIKTGNMFRTLVNGYQVSKTLSNNSGYSLFFNFNRQGSYRVIQGTVTKAFKIN